MKLVKIFFILLYLIAYCQAQEINFECIKKIHKIRSISPEDEKYNDLRFLDNIIEGKRIVLLGETRHSDGSTFLAKSRLIKYLIEKHGFNVVAFEGGSFSNINYPDNKSTISPSDLLIKYWYTFWSRTKEVKSLFSYLDKIHLSSSIDIVGIESQMNFVNSFGYLDSLYQFITISINKDSLDHILEKHNKEVRNYLFGKKNPEILSPSEWGTLKDYLSMMKMNLESLSLNTLDELKKTYYLRSLENSILWCESKLIDQNNSKELDKKIKQRDKAMFENLMWYINNHSDKKIIIWAANFHIAYNLNNIIYTPDSSFYNYMIPLGHYIKEKFKGESYHIAFNDALGIKEVDYINNSTLEEYLFKRKYNYAFIDLEIISDNKSCNELIFRSQLFGNIHKGKWFQSFDGIFFIRDMKESTF